MKKWFYPVSIFLLIIIEIILGILIFNEFFSSPKVPDQKIFISSTPTLTITPTSTPTLTPTPTPTPKPTSIPTPAQSLSLDDLFNKYGAIYGVDPGVLRSIASCESGFDPSQVTGDYAGLFQFGSLPWQEARGRLGENPDLSLRFNAEESVKTAAHEIQIKGTSGWSDCD